jgi:hypothetical protein
VRNFVPLLFLFAVGFIGCDEQHGRFYMSGESYTAFRSNVGGVDIVDGYSAQPINETDGNEQHLLYILIICPGVRAHSSTSSSDSGRYFSTLDYSWDTENGKISMQVQWNRDSDTVAIGDQKFDRNKGNVLVVRRETNGKIVGEQLSSLGTHAAFSEVLYHVQQKLTNDQLIASLELNK